MSEEPVPLRKERPPEDLTAGLIQLLTVDTLDDGLYQGAPLPGGKGRVFGGQVVAQALQAARRTVDLGPAHSLHCYFMRPGEEGLPIIYQVTRDHDGRSFATRRVIASQRGVPILSMLLSFQAEEEGLEHQIEMPDVPPPEDLVSEIEYWKARADKLPDWAMRHLLRPRPVEFRHVNPRSPFGSKPRPPKHASWFRTVAPLPDDPALHQAVLAYASDMTLLGTSSLPHGISYMTSGLQSASLDHALWFHSPVPADDWILYVTDSPWSGGARGFNRGHFFTRHGKLVASVAQEGLMRLRKTEPEKSAR